MYEIEHNLWKKGKQYVMGIDEVGRGALAGPVVVAGVVMNPNYCILHLKDSKALYSHQREVLDELIRKHVLFYTIQQGSVSEIDTLNIHHATLLCMLRCVRACHQFSLHHILIDGRFMPKVNIPSQCIVKGDTKSASIASASIIAKVYRDLYMKKLHDTYPKYDWLHNVGYPSYKHRLALSKYGMTTEHRKSFKWKRVPIL